MSRYHNYVHLTLFTMESGRFATNPLMEMTDSGGRDARLSDTSLSD